MQSLAPGCVVAGRYEVQRCLGQGGMGSVWAARDHRLRRDVALKILVEVYANVPEARARFEREAQSAAALDSPHVVQVFDFGVEGGAPYLVMEQLRGENLADRLEREHRLTLVEAASLAHQIASGLEVAHAAGIVHRDLKPANVFMMQKSGGPVVKILDFGIAKVLRPEPGPDMTRTHALLGTPRYMSPEQVRGAKHVDHRTDLWAFGVILFEAITGVKPFPGQSVGDISVKICVEPIPVPTEVAPDLPAAADAFFARALARPVEGRFASAREMASAFASLLAAPRPPSLPPAPPPRGAPRRSAPGRQATAIVAAIFGAATLAGGASLAVDAFDDGAGGETAPSIAAPPRDGLSSASTPDAGADAAATAASRVEAPPVEPVASPPPDAIAPAPPASQATSPRKAPAPPRATPQPAPRLTATAPGKVPLP